MAIQTATKPEGPTGDFKGNIQVDNTPPNTKMLQKAEGLILLDKDKNMHSFKSLYEGKGRVLVVFIRHFFCGNCQEYIRTLGADLPPSTLSALPTPTSLIVIGCGTADLIGMYTRETNCPFPVYADPTRKIYDVLGMTKTLSLGDKTPQYMRQPLYRVVFQSFVQELKSGRKMLSGGDFWQVGGEFMFEPDGTVSWCHRMKNTRDHAEIDEMRKELHMDGEPTAVAPGKPIGSRRSMSSAGLGAGLVRRLSDRRRSWRSSMSRSRSRNTEAGVPRGAMEKLKEEDGAPEGGRDAALAKLTGGANGNTQAPATSDAVLNGETEHHAINGAATEGLANGTATPAENGIATEGHPDHTPETPIIANGSAIEPTANGHANGATVNGSEEKSTSNGSVLKGSTPFVQSLMNGSIEGKPSKINGSAEGNFDSVVADDAKMPSDGAGNGHVIEA